jgi:hypothetical protein
MYREDQIKAALELYHQCGSVTKTITAEKTVHSKELLLLPNECFKIRQRQI